MTPFGLGFCLFPWTLDSSEREVSVVDNGNTVAPFNDLVGKRPGDGWKLATLAKSAALTKLAVIGVLAVVFAAAGCTQPTETSVEAVRSALTNADVLGFETLGSWSTTTAGAVLGLSPTHSQGASALSLRPSNGNGFTPIVSVSLSTLSEVSPTLSWDLMLPTQQPNPNWLGTAQTYINCPSRGLFNTFLGQVELTGKPLNVFNTLTFSLNNDQISRLLLPGYSDLTITVVVTVQVPTTGTYRIDNLRFTPAAANGCGGRPNGTFCTDNNACTQVDQCQSGSCQGSSPIICAALDQCHLAGTCASSTGICSNPAKTNGSACNDGNACSQTDTCQAGTCTGANPKVCVATDGCHSPGTCAPSTGICSNPVKPGDAVCGTTGPKMGTLPTNNMPTKGSGTAINPTGNPPKGAPGTIPVPTPEIIRGQFGTAAKDIPGNIPGQTGTTPKLPGPPVTIPGFYGRIRVTLNSVGITPTAGLVVSGGGSLQSSQTVDGPLLIVARNNTTPVFVETARDARVASGFAPVETPLQGHSLIPIPQGELLFSVPSALIASSAATDVLGIDIYQTSFSLPADTAVTVANLPTLMQGATLLGSINPPTLTSLFFSIEVK